ncbi:AMP-binding protein [Alsobacter sp. SYSU M60028]|uniref:AMP-binding protein n=1 Tax=Alsobacter ponti TaxID=2962936 RepID=A0ABT1LFP8_9HYPH|nr:AMP-binding protein [Alsobacter ponti]MCP8939713.1 AMP-binding protein [Alsobacter ponti]
MTEHYDELETRPAAEREADLFRRLPATVAKAMTGPGWARHLAGVDPGAVSSPAALAALPVLRKSELPARQKADPPFAGFAAEPLSSFGRLYVSPGPIFEPEGTQPDPWRVARALFAAGVRRGDIVLNTFSYHLTPGAFMMDAGARALGCPVIPAGPGQTEQQLDVIAHLRPVAYCGTPDFLKILLDAGEKAGKPAASLRKAFVSGAAFPATLRDELLGRGVAAYQAYAVADVGVVAYETPAREGLVASEDLILEIVRPGTGEPVPDGEVGEVVVTSLNPVHPVIRLALGDLSAVLAGPSPCGRTARRIKGWMGRADQTAKVKGMFVRPEQIAEILRRHPGVGRARLVVSRRNEQDAMTLHVEAANPDPDLAASMEVTLQAVTRLRGDVAVAAPGALPNDGKVIADERPVG